MDNELDQASVRTWLPQMPDAGFFTDKAWFACDSNGEWWLYFGAPERGGYHWMGDSQVELGSELFNMPDLTGDQWKYSCISVIELAEWQQEKE